MSGLRPNIPSNLIFYKLHHAGLMNRFYSFQCAMALSFLMDRNLVLYNIKDIEGKILDDPSVHYIKNYKMKYGKKSNIVNYEYTNFFDLIDYEKERVFQTIDYHTINNFHEKENVISEMLHNCFIDLSENDNNTEDKKLFNAFEIDIKNNGPYHFKGYNLSNYSTLFFNRTKELDYFLSNINFKKEYIEFANLLSNSLGNYNAIHVRLTDHRHNFDVKEKQLNDAIDLLNNLPIVVLTDEPDNDMFKNKNIILIDDFIVDNFSDDFLKLSINSEIVFGLISMLVACNAVDFIGTYYSTFTSYIHRQHYQKQNNTISKFLGMPEMSENGKPWSWVGQGNQGIARDWPESRLMI